MTELGRDKEAKATGKVVEVASPTVSSSLALVEGQDT